MCVFMDCLFSVAIASCREPGSASHTGVCTLLPPSLHTRAPILQDYTNALELIQALLYAIKKLDDKVPIPRFCTALGCSGLYPVPCVCVWHRWVHI
jgi:hypothetical protein